MYMYVIGRPYVHVIHVHVFVCPQVCACMCMRVYVRVYMRVCDFKHALGERHT